MAADAQPMALVNSDVASTGSEFRKVIDYEKEKH
jgi:hypothetical protein